MIDNFRGKYNFLSNFYESCVSIPGFEENLICRTVEHAYQASKTLNPIHRKEIAWAQTPSDAKRLGRSVDLRPDWEKVKVDVMRDLIKQKFSITPLKMRLLATEDEKLVEGNTWHDNFWGDCHCSRCSKIQGKNMLGIILMEERERIKRDIKGD